MTARAVGELAPGDCLPSPLGLAILRGLAAGLTLAEIGRSQFYCERQTKYHLTAMLRAYGCRNGTQLVATALRAGWLV